MAELGPITIVISASLGNAALPVDPIKFDVPLRAVAALSLTETEASYELTLDRTELRDQLTKSIRVLADQIEAAFTSGGGVLTCIECGAQLVNRDVAELRHEADGSHSLAPVRVAARASIGESAVIADGIAVAEMTGSTDTDESAGSSK